jgi:hypothetical protein
LTDTDDPTFGCGPPSEAHSSKLGGGTIRSAKVAADGTVDAAHSDSITSANVTKTGKGEYCIHGLSPAPHGAAASLDYHAGFHAQLYISTPKLLDTNPG